MDSLAIGKPSCKIKKGCILEGELVVYSDKVLFSLPLLDSAHAYDDQEEKVMPFHKIRKYVSRSGRFLAVDQDSQYVLYSCP